MRGGEPIPHRLARVIDRRRRGYFASQRGSVRAPSCRRSR